MSPGTVAVQTTAEIVGYPGQVAEVRLSYDAKRPLEVEAVFAHRSGTKTWPFARDLLALGLHRPAGLGDLRVAPVGERIYLYLSSPDGSVTLRLPRAPVETFVEAMLLLVPPGEEVIEFDEELTKLLDGAR